MKLKKLMRKNGIKFPEGLYYAAQDGNGIICFYTSKPIFSNTADLWHSRNNFASSVWLDEVASNYKTKVVTREEYEA